MVEQLNDAATIAEMRAEIERIGNHDPMVRSALSVGFHGDLSPADTYTLLAYHALRERAVMKRLLKAQAELQTARLTSASGIIALGGKP
jgi:hypothetical protein